MEAVSRQLLSDLSFGASRQIAEAVAIYMESLSRDIGPEHAATVTINACCAATVGIYKTWATATGRSFNPEYLRKCFETALTANFVVCERKADGSFAEPTPLQ